MPDAISATETALFQALNTGIVGATVYQHVPEDAPLPVVIIGDIEGGKPIGLAGDPDQTIPVTIVVITEGEERAPCTALINQALAVLDGKSLVQPGFTVRPILEAWSAGIAEDGFGYIGTAAFTVFALSD